MTNISLKQYESLQRKLVEAFGVGLAEQKANSEDALSAYKQMAVMASCNFKSCHMNAAFKQSI